MDKQQAESALGIIRDVIQNTREDLATQNWGLIWILHAFTNGTTYCAIGYFAERNERTIFWYLVPLAVVAVVNVVIIAVFSERDRGVRSFVEQQVHGIWISFVVFTLAGAAVLELWGHSPLLFGPIIGLNSGYAFAMMGVVFSKKFFLTAFMFLIVGIFASSLAVTQWYLLGLAWWIAMITPGVTLHRERRQRLEDEQTTTIA